MNSPLKLIAIVTALLLLFLGSCGRVSSREKVFLPEANSKTDSICKWLEVNDNFYEERYYPVFNAYYEQKLKEKDYASAVLALNAVADNEMYFLTFDQKFETTLKLFDSLYAKHVSWTKTLFIYSYKGNHLTDKGEFRKAIACFRKGTARKPIDYTSCFEIAYMFSDMAFCYSAIGDQERALRCNHRALFYFNKTNDLAGKGVVYDHIALVHLFTKNYAEAELYFTKAIDAYRQSKDMSNVFVTLHNRILLYQEMDNPKENKLIDSTYKVFIASGLEDPSLEVSLSNFYIGKLLYEGKTEEARQVLQKMKILTEKLKSPASDDEYHISQAQYELSTGGIINIALVEDALRAVEESEHFQNQLAFCYVLKENALLNKDYEKALIYSEKEKIAQNNLSTREMIVKTMELNKKHQTEKKEQRIMLQSKTILNKNIAIALLLAILVAFSLVVVIINSRQKQKKIKMEGQRAILYTRQLLEKTEEERKRIAGDLHDSVSHELLNLKNTIHENNSETSDKIDAIINDIRIISRNLHPIMFEKVGLEASLEQLVERAQSIHDLMVTTNIEYDRFLSVSDELQVYRMVQEALSNTIKYADAFAARIILTTNSDVLQIQIQDNGKGFDVAEKMSGSTAFGLHNILERSKAIGGFAKIHSDKNGTLITIEIKKQHENTDS